MAYRALKRRFELDDEYLEDLKAELIDAKRVAVDEDDKVLVWVGEGRKGETAKGGNGNPEGEKGKWGNGDKGQTPIPFSPFPFQIVIHSQ